MELTRSTVIDFLDDLFARRGADAYLGEPVTMAAHMLQCAQHAEQAGAEAALVVAALLHDIGHFTSELPPDAYKDETDNRHEAFGARVLEPYFPPSVTEPIRLHVPAKRYLCAVDTRYVGCLSEASMLSLRLQGGPMNLAEVAEFETNPYHQAAVALRRWDDLGKLPGAATADFAYYRPLLARLVR